MRDEKEGRKKQARSNKQQGMYMYIIACIIPIYVPLVSH